MRTSILTLLLASVLLSTQSVYSQGIYEGYLDHAQLQQAITQLQARHPAEVTISSVGTSRLGRTIPLLIISGDGKREGEGQQKTARPALLVVAAADSRHLMGTEIAIRAVGHVLESHPEILQEIDVFLIPRLNPDGAEVTLTQTHANTGGTRRVIDADRDGLLDEDPPRDLNGDGFITQMRILEPTIDQPATHITDPADPRLHVTPKSTEGERAAFRILIEGTDSDGDGQFSEDGEGEVHLDHNFMHLWQEHNIASGPYPLSEPEARAIADFVIAHPQIIAAVVYGPHDTVIALPDTKPKDSSGRVPRNLHPGDKAMQESLGALYRETTGQERSSNTANQGSLQSWLYAHRGIPTLATTGWGRPDPTPLPAPEPPEGEDEEPEEAEAQPEPEPRDKEEAGWLAYSDRDRGGVGFIAWEAFDHPEFGPVEIGGFVPGFQNNAPIEFIEQRAKKHADLYAKLAAKRANMRIEGPEIEPVGSGLYRVRLALINDGELPTLSAMARQNRAVRPIAIRLGLDLERIHEGKGVHLLRGLDAHGGRHAQEWLIRPGPDPIAIEIDDPAQGVRVIPLDFSQGDDQ